MESKMHDNGIGKSFPVPNTEKIKEKKKKVFRGCGSGCGCNHSFWSTVEA